MAAFTNNNTRIFYATQAVTIGAIGNTDTIIDSDSASALGSHKVVHGLQSIGVDTNFNLEQAFELGQLSLYENIEDIPDISVSMSKFLDGYSLLYHLGASFDGDGNVVTGSSPTTLAGRADTRADIRLLINKTTDESVNKNDSGVAECYCSGMYLSSVSYTIPTDGTCTEEVSFVGNNKRWFTSDASGILLLAGGVVHSGFGSGTNAIFGSDAPNTTDGHVLRREDVVASGGKKINGYMTCLPTIIEGIYQDSGQAISPSNRVPSGAGLLNTNVAHINSFTCSTDLGREAINQLGTRTPYSRYVSFPTEVTSMIEVTAIGGDNVNAVETARSNLTDHEICVVLSDSTVFHLGRKNKVASITYGGGDAGGGNATITYNFSNFNDLVVLHSGDPIAAGATTSGIYWNDRFA